MPDDLFVERLRLVHLIDPRGHHHDAVRCQRFREVARLVARRGIKHRPGQPRMDQHLREIAEGPARAHHVGKPVPAAASAVVTDREHLERREMARSPRGRPATARRWRSIAPSRQNPRGPAGSRQGLPLEERQDLGLDVERASRPAVSARFRLRPRHHASSPAGPTFARNAGPASASSVSPSRASDRLGLAPATRSRSPRTPRPIRREQLPGHHQRRLRQLREHPDRRAARPIDHLQHRALGDHRRPRRLMVRAAQPGRPSAYRHRESRSRSRPGPEPEESAADRGTR